MEEIQLKDKLKKRTEILKKHIDEYDRLRAEGDFKNAWTKLLEAMRYGNETLKMSTKVLEEAASKGEIMPKDLKISLDKGRETIKSVDNVLGIMDLTNGRTSQLVKKDCQISSSRKGKGSVKKMIVIPKHQSIN